MAKSESMNPSLENPALNRLRDHPAALKAGLLAGLGPAGAVLGTSFIGFGTLARSSGFDLWQSLATSVFIWPCRARSRWWNWSPPVPGSPASSSLSH